MVRVIVRRLLIVIAVLLCAGAWAQADNEEKMMWAAGKASGYSGLETGEAVDTEFFSDKERMKDVMRILFRRDFPEDKYQALNAVMLKFGFSLFDDESEDDIIDDYTKGILGVYDDDDKKIYVVSSELYEELRDERYDECDINEIYISDPVYEDWLMHNRPDIVLVHESLHALQDQHFDLWDWHEKYRYNDDAHLAIKTMIEGQAEYVERKYLLEALKLPDFYAQYAIYGESWNLRDFAIFDERVEEYMDRADSSRGSTCAEDVSFLWWLSNVPYMIGSDFINKVENDQGASQINSVFTHCPLSSEQILNTDKFFKEETEDRPTFINLPSFEDVMDRDAWRFIDYNSMGQLKLYLLCRDLYYDPLEICHPMAEGWDGDRYAVWRDEDDYILLAWFTTWDTEDDAQEFYNFYREAWDNKGVSSGRSASGDNWRRILADEDSMYMEIDGADVLIIEGPLDEDQFDAFADVLRESEKYEADYDICTMTSDEFNDTFAMYAADEESSHDDDDEEDTDSDDSDSDDEESADDDSGDDDEEEETESDNSDDDDDEDSEEDE